MDCLYHCPSKPKDTLSDKKKGMIWKQGSLLHLEDINVNHGVFQIRCQFHNMSSFYQQPLIYFWWYQLEKKQMRGHLTLDRKMLPTAVLIRYANART